MTTKLDEVRAAIIAAVLEIVELRFGCEIWWCEAQSNVVEYVPGEKGQGFVIIEPRISGCDMIYLTDSRFKILGRTIRLADFLAATPTMIEVSSHAGGAIYHYPNGDHAPRKSSGVYWNLRADDLSQQSPEFIDFAHSLLCV